MGQGGQLKGKSYAGKNPFGKYRTRAINDLIHYFMYIPCVKIGDVMTILVSEKVVAILAVVLLVG